MIHHVDAHQHTRRRQPSRQLHVLGTRRGIAGGMIVEHDDRGRAAERRLAKHLARLHARRVQRPDAPAPPSASRGASCRAARTPNCSTGRPPNRGIRYAAASWGSSKLHPRARRVRQRPAPEFERRDDLRRPRAADAGDARRDRRSEHRVSPCSPPCAASSSLATRQRARPPRAAAEDERDQLVVAERRRAVARQLLARPIVGRQVFHLYYSRPACSGSRESRVSRRGFTVSRSIVEGHVSFALYGFVDSTAASTGMRSRTPCARFRLLRG